MARPVIVGAVLYDPRVSVIWGIIRDFFETSGCPIDVRLYNDYAVQTTALRAGEIDVAWQSPLAWLDTLRRVGPDSRAIAMRDTDRDRVSHLVVRADGGVSAPTDLRGTMIAVGAKDSPQATLIPLGHLRSLGLEAGRDFRVKRHDVLVGKHGDHTGGELDAFRALERGDVAASCMLDLNWNAWTRDGTVDPARFTQLESTPRFDHCVFAVRADFPHEVERRWLETLFSMRYENPAHREMMDLEGLTAWLPGRTSGFGPLSEAVRAFRFFDGADGMESR